MRLVSGRLPFTISVVDLLREHFMLRYERVARVVTLVYLATVNARLADTRLPQCLSTAHLRRVRLLAHHSTETIAIQRYIVNEA